MATILVVDDRPVNRQFLVTLLGYSGHRLLEAADGLEALQIAQAEHPDLAIVDIVMPTMDGYAFVQQIRANPELARMPVIFYTATYLESAARQLAESSGVSYVLTKPADPEVVLKAVGEALGQSPGEAVPAPRVERPPEDALRLLNVKLSSKLADVVPRLTALVEIGIQFAIERDLNRLVQRVGAAARRIVDARHAAVGLLDEGAEGTGRVFLSSDAAEETLEAQSIPAGEGVLRTILTDRRAVRLPDLDGQPGTAWLPCDPAGGPCAFLGVPLASAHQLYGFVCLTGKVGADEFSEEDEQLVQALATQAATRYENAKLYQELQDHTTQLQLEMAERARLAGELQRRMEELTAANRRKDEFLAMLSHELRNPLAAIASAGGVLDQRLGPDASTAMARDVLRRQTANLTHMVDDLLDASRITRGQVELKKAPVDVAVVVESAVVAARPLIEGRGHSLSVSLPSEPIALNADATRLEQVIANVIVNAAKYTDPGGQIWVTAEVEDGWVSLRVRDTGRGIAPDLLPHIFDLFAQGDRTLDRSEGGLGIGLSVVRTLVELHGGTVDAHSDGLGKGSEFVICLPLRVRGSGFGVQEMEAAEPTNARVKERGSQERELAAGEASPTEPRTLNPEPSAEPRTSKPAMRVLIVDDNADAAELLAMILETEGYQVRAEHSGPAALSAACEYHPDVILLDLGMPGMDGYEVARRLRAWDEACGRAILVAVTGYGEEEDRQRSHEAGFDEHLVKPVNMDALHRALQQAVH